MNPRPQYAAQQVHDGARPLHVVIDVSQSRPRPVIALDAAVAGTEEQAAALALELAQLDAQLQALRDQRRALLAQHAAEPGSRRPVPAMPTGFHPRDTSKAVLLVRRRMAGLTLPEAMHLLDSEGWSWKLTSLRRPSGEIVYLARVFRPDLECVGKKMADQQPVAALTEAWASAEQLLNSAAYLDARRASLAGLNLKPTQEKE